ncbi:MAG: FkbM family methyltransferase, partial [Actinobacteria bacterium]|nr:FkbM family methyltransferase [Actinomycetota bacterium]
MRIGVLTGGGDCPGLNAVIRAVVRKGVKEYGYEFIGFKDGWRGPLEGLTMKLDIPATRGILPKGGTILGSSRTNPFKIEGGVEKIKESAHKSNGTFFDIGANQGVFSMIAAKNKHCKNIHEFEPNSNLIEFLESNFLFNNLKNYTIHNFAISSRRFSIIFSGVLKYFAYNLFVSSLFSSISLSST